MLRELNRFVWSRIIGRILTKPFVKLTIIGRENVPPEGAGGLLIIANHFSWFEAPIIIAYLPLHVRFMAATELQRNWFLRHALRATRAIPVWRGTVDRQALKTAIDALRNNETVAIFPEGGVDPSLQQTVAAGQQITAVQGHISRLSGELAPIRTGAAYLAVAGGARILPVAVRGGEHVEAALVRPWRRTPVTVEIGAPFGPLELDPALRGAARRARLDELGDDMMRRLAALFPPEKRGPYA